LRLVRIVLEEAGETPVAIGGELAAQLDSIPTLLKLGVRRLSVAPPSYPAPRKRSAIPWCEKGQATDDRS
jgi:phosphoenolpyruvate-protein kinase (PTS system EI component)